MKKRGKKVFSVVLLIFALTGCMSCAGKEAGDTETEDNGRQEDIQPQENAEEADDTRGADDTQDAENAQEIERGEFVAITGKSGCDKSTMPNILGGMDRRRGNIYLRMWMSAG